MKRLLRTLLLNTTVVFLAARILPGLSYSEDFQILILAAIALGLVNLTVRPIVKLVTLPINLLTLGIFSWGVNVLMLYLVTQLVPGFSVSAFHFEGWSYQGFTLPELEVTTLMSYILSSFLISFLTSTLGWLFD